MNKVKLYNDLISEQRFELFFLVPSGILFNTVCVYLLFSYTNFFITQNNHLWLICLQVIFSIGFLLLITKSFKKRAKLISNTVHN